MHYLQEGLLKVCKMGLLLISLKQGSSGWIWVAALQRHALKGGWLSLGYLYWFLLLSSFTFSFTLAITLNYEQTILQANTPSTNILKVLSLFTYRIFCSKEPVNMGDHLEYLVVKKTQTLSLYYYIKREHL